MFSYSALNNSGKVTLPSVDSALGTLYVEKDPNAGVYTRKVDKVGSDSELLNLGDRNASRDTIQPYARGVNPAVCVSYNNTSCGKQAYLPNQIRAFRPPIMTKEQLLPLSRQSRAAFNRIIPQNSMCDWTKKPYIATGKEGVFEDKITYNVPGTVQNIQYDTAAPVVNPDNYIQNGIKVKDAESGVRTRDLTELNVQIPYAQAFNQTFQTTNVTAPSGGLYQKQVKVGPVNPMTSALKDASNIKYTTGQISTDGRGSEWIHGDVMLGEALNAQAFTNRSGQSMWNTVEPTNAVLLTRNTPIASTTGRTESVNRNAFDLSGSRDFQLKTTTNRGQAPDFYGHSFIPQHA